MSHDSKTAFCIEKACKRKINKPNWTMRCKQKCIDIAWRLCWKFFISFQCLCITKGNSIVYLSLHNFKAHFVQWSAYFAFCAWCEIWDSEWWGTSEGEGAHIIYTIRGPLPCMCNTKLILVLQWKFVITRSSWTETSFAFLPRVFC